MSVLLCRFLYVEANYIDELYEFRIVIQAVIKRLDDQQTTELRRIRTKRFAVIYTVFK